MQCQCGIVIDESDIKDFRSDILPPQIYKESTNYSSVAAIRKSFLLKCYLQLRFPESTESKKAKKEFFSSLPVSVDIDNLIIRTKYLELLKNSTEDFYEVTNVNITEVICGKCGATNLYTEKNVQCSRCGDWLYQYLSEKKSEAATVGSPFVCPHCQKKGFVRTKEVKRKKGISGAKATGAILTGGWSLLATGLAKKERGTQAHCDNCGATWDF